MFVCGTCEAGGRIKPGAQAPGKRKRIWDRARKAGDSVYRLSPAPRARIEFFAPILGLAPQALCLRLLRRLIRSFYEERIKKSEDAGNNNTDITAEMQAKEWFDL